MDLIEEILTALRTEDRVMLATVIASSGSTPAAVSSKMLIIEEGRASVGTVGGGCMEGDVLLEAAKLFPSAAARVLTFRLTEDDAESGLICGGSADVLIEPLSRDDSGLFSRLKALRDDGRDTVLATHVTASGRVGGKWLLDPSAGAAGDLTDIPVAGMGALALHAAARRVPVADGEVVLETVPGRPHLVIFGGGHVSRYLSGAAATAGFRITIVDDREKYANPARFPEAERTVAAGFTDAFSSISIERSTFIVIVTRGHRHDEEVLERALGTPARYIGMIGSRRKVLVTYEHLLERGVDAASLRRVRAPVGIEIGAVTAEEIALSIVSELIAERRGAAGALPHKSAAMEDFFNKRAAPAPPI